MKTASPINRTSVHRSCSSLGTLSLANPCSQLSQLLQNCIVPLEDSMAQGKDYHTRSRESLNKPIHVSILFATHGTRLSCFVHAKMSIPLIATTKPSYAYLAIIFYALIGRFHSMNPRITNHNPAFWTIYFFLDILANHSGTRSIFEYEERSWIEVQWHWTVTNPLTDIVMLKASMEN